MPAIVRSPQCLVPRGQLPGRSWSAGDLASLQSGFWSLRSGVRAQLDRGPEAAAILVARGRWDETVFPSSAAILFSPEFTPIFQAGLRSPWPILRIIFGVWKCYYFGRAPFAAPERCAKRAASSPAGHAPRPYYFVELLLQEFLTSGFWKYQSQKPSCNVQYPFS
ncbi:hypothetical protein NDU88_009944 [Pleurodeles waltl]|uniref:Uncharacterized protein n=1 Tax=Pleurodeles waltl TaxID=8319 RepID=A0AAV7QT03_PLEWA|nr:hypothetical protein NDU88_009944 [Pleurodeles waltl]